MGMLMSVNCAIGRVELLWRSTVGFSLWHGNQLRYHKQDLQNSLGNLGQLC